MTLVTRASTFVLFSLTLIGLIPKAHSAELVGALQLAASSRVAPDDLVVSYNDRHALWGGVVITIKGNGDWEKSCQPRGGAASPPALHGSGQLDRHRLGTLLKLLVDLRVWQQIAVDHPPVPDESRAHLKVSRGSEKVGFWEWYNEMKENNRLIKIYAEMEAQVPKPICNQNAKSVPN
jgi:hypothetical protein